MTHTACTSKAQMAVSEDSQELVSGSRLVAIMRIKGPVVHLLPDGREVSTGR